MKMRLSETKTERRIKCKCIHLKECAVMMEIITNKPVGHRRLRAYRF